MEREAMLILFALQLALPLLLLLWLAIAAPASRVGLALHVVAIAVWLLAIALSGVWTLAPWWTPHALALVLTVITIWRLANSGGLPVMPVRLHARIGACASLMVALAALLQSAAAIGGRSEPPGPIADIASPLLQGTFLVVNGGSDTRVNAHLNTLSPELRYRNWRAQSHGIDLIRVDSLGFRARGLLPADPAAYVGFGSTVYAPCKGSILLSVDGLEDNTVPRTDQEQLAGNYIIVRCEGFDVALAHLRRSSVLVVPGELVMPGQPLAELGNSGNSDEPHLHLHAQRSTPVDAPFSGEPLPLRIGGRYLVRNQRLVELPATR